MGDMHPTEQEKQRLLALSDGAPWERVDAILDELHDRGAEWDDARTALSALVEDERAEVERLRSQLARHLGAWRNAARRARIWRDHAAEEAETVEWMGDLLKVARPEPRAAQLDGIENRVTAAFADTDERKVSLDAMTVTELTELVMDAVRRDDDPPA